MYNYGGYDPLGGMGFAPMMPMQQQQFAPLAPFMPPPSGQGKGALSGYINPQTVGSFMGFGSGGANFGDQARNWLGGVMNPSDPYGVASKNASAGLGAPDASGATLTAAFGGDTPAAPQMNFAPMAAPALPQQDKGKGGGSLLSMLTGGLLGGGGAGKTSLLGLLF